VRYFGVIAFHKILKLNDKLRSEAIEDAAINPPIGRFKSLLVLTLGRIYNDRAKIK
jgi:hypothetical protein